MEEQGSRWRAARRAVVDVLISVVQALIVFTLLSALIGRYEIKQTSMEPNFHEGQRIFVSRVGALWSHLFVGSAYAAEPGRSALGLDRGEIIVFTRDTSGGSEALIKRVIALPGDTIEIRDGRVFVNGRALDEAYIHGMATSCSEVCGPLRLADDEYFLMGDNRPVSLDSRSFGPVHAEQIVGRVVMRFWPLDQVAVFP